MTAVAAGLSRQVARWTTASRIPAASFSGTAFACGICAAVWLSAGTWLGRLAGVTALGAAALAQAGARRSAVTARRPAMGQAMDGWLAAGCAAAAEFAAYGGLAAGAPAGQQRGVWPLAAGALILLAFRQMMALCREPPAGGPFPAFQAVGAPGAAGTRGAGDGSVAPGGGAGPDDGAAPGGRVREESPLRLLARLAWRLLALPPGLRVALFGVTALVWGPRVTFAALAAGGTVALAAGLARRLPVLSPAGLPGCRGDGPLARRAGWLARGQLAPLPPVVAGLAATTLLALVGLRGLAGVVMLAPVAAMLLAAAGASHPHTGRLDWLVPPALQAGQYVYLAALGFAAGVPGALTFSLICVIALRHLDAAYRSRHQLGWRPRYAGAGLGWEGRMLAAGLAALLGIATFAYLVLTAYLGVLLGWICLSSWYAAQEGVRE